MLFVGPLWNEIHEAPQNQIQYMPVSYGSEPPPIEQAVYDVDEIRGLLTRDSVSRKTRKWHLLTDSEMELLLDITEKYRSLTVRRQPEFLTINRRVAEDDYGSTDIGAYRWKHLQEHVISNNLSHYFPLVIPLLNEFSGSIWAAGGAIFKAMHGYSNYASDIDLFFVDPNVENDNVSDAEKKDAATELLLNATTFLSERWLGNDFVAESADDNVNRKVYILRNEFVTTVYLSSRAREIKIQFIHRVYPSIGHILGGFDLGPCMIAFDGKQFAATELGAWSVFSKTLIVDVSRRSTSFEHRLQKYAKYCHVIFPGLSGNIRPPCVAEWKTMDEMSNIIRNTIHENGFYFKIKTKTGRFGGDEKTKAKLRKVRIVGDTIGTNGPPSADSLARMLNQIARNNGYHMNIDPKTLIPIKREYNSSFNGDKEALLQLLAERTCQGGYFFNWDNYVKSMVDADGYTDPMEYPDPAGYLTQFSEILHLGRLDINLDFRGDAVHAVRAQNPGRRWNIRVARPADTQYGIEKPSESSDYSDATTEFKVIHASEMLPNSDYSDSSVWAESTVSVNAAHLASGNISAVVSILGLLRPDSYFEPIPTYDRHRMNAAQLARDVLRWTMVEIGRVPIRDLIKESFTKINLGHVQRVLDWYIDFEHKIRDPSILSKSVDIHKINPVAIARFKGAIVNRIELVMAKLSGVSWIIRNAGAQWTSSIHSTTRDPKIDDPREWYGEQYQSFRIGNIQTETLLRLCRRVPDNLFSKQHGLLNNDIFNKVLLPMIMVADSSHLLEYEDSDDSAEVE